MPAACLLATCCEPRQALDARRMLVTARGPTSQLMMVARLLSSSRTALSSHQAVEHLAARLATGGCLDLETEVGACRLVAAACRARLAQMPTSLEDDLALLAEAGLDDDMRTCIRYRLARKRFLAAAARRLDDKAAVSLSVGRVSSGGGSGDPAGLEPGLVHARMPERLFQLVPRNHVCSHD